MAALLLGALVLPFRPCLAQRPHNPDNPGVVKIDDTTPFKQILAISDVHGRYSALIPLLQAAKVIDTSPKHNWIADNTLLVVCGDSIDKGDDSVDILKLWQYLVPQAAKKHGRIVLLLGNHEAEFLSDPHGKQTAVFQQQLKAAGLKRDAVANGTDSLGIGKLLLSMPLAARIGTYLFCHAGWFPPNTSWKDFAAQAKSVLTAGNYLDNLIIGQHSILEEKDETLPGQKAEKWYKEPAEVALLEKRINKLGLYGVVFGHQPKAFDFTAEIGGVDNLHIIKIDSGMAPDAADSAGQILCFPNPKDLTKPKKTTPPPTLQMPQVERILPDGTHAPLPTVTVKPVS